MSSIYTVMALLFFVLTPHANAESPAETFGLSAGEKAPEIESKDIDGKEFTLSKAVTKGPVVLVFYRGGWCPFCNLQLRSLQEKVVPTAKARGAAVVAISVDKPDLALATKNKEKLDMRILSDPKAAILGNYRVKFTVPAELVKKYKDEYKIDLEASSGETHHVIAVPAVFVIGRDGKVAYAYANEDYKVRAAETEVIKAIEAAAAKGS